jgi:hypothetical protein
LIAVRARFSHWIPRGLGVKAIVLYPYMLFSAAREEVELSLWRHEMIHVRQVRHCGWLRFYGRYLAEYFTQRLGGKSAQQASRDISFEQDAYGMANRIELTEAEKKETGLA